MSATNPAPLPPANPHTPRYRNRKNKKRFWNSLGVRIKNQYRHNKQSWILGLAVVLALFFGYKWYMCSQNSQTVVTNTTTETKVDANDPSKVTTSTTATSTTPQPKPNPVVMPSATTSTTTTSPAIAATAPATTTSVATTVTPTTISSGVTPAEVSQPSINDIAAAFDRSVDKLGNRLDKKFDQMEKTMVAQGDRAEANNKDVQTAIKGLTTAVNSKPDIRNAVVAFAPQSDGTYVGTFNGTAGQAGSTSNPSTTQQSPVQANVPPVQKTKGTLVDVLIVKNDFQPDNFYKEVPVSSFGSLNGATTFLPPGEDAPVITTFAVLQSYPYNPGDPNPRVTYNVYAPDGSVIASDQDVPIRELFVIKVQQGSQTRSFSYYKRNSDGKYVMKEGDFLRSARKTSVVLSQLGGSQTVENANPMSPEQVQQPQVPNPSNYMPAR